MRCINIEELCTRFRELYSCERLSHHEENQALVQAFTCTRNEVLEAHLKKHAWDSDRNGENAYYLIKDKEDNVAFYFSIKCGLLSQKIEQKYLLLADRMDEVVRAYDERNHGAIVRIANEIGISPSTIVNNINALKQKAQQYNRDKEISQELDILRVHETYSAIELVEFCANESYRETWQRNEFQLPIGVCVFWFYIVPMVLKIQEIVGCRYLYLFAADDTEDLDLCNYYDNDLGFCRIEEVSVLKPRYDYTCIPMYQKIEDLLETRESKIPYVMGVYAERYQYMDELDTQGSLCME